MPKKKPEKSLDELLEEAIVKEGEQPYEVPGNWEWVKIGDNFELRNEKLVPQNGDNLPYIGLEHMAKGGGILSVSNTEDIKSSKSIFKRNDVLYSKLRPYLDKHSQVDFNGVCSTDILVFRNKKHYLPILLDMYLGLSSITQSSVENSSGINLPRVSGKIVSKFPMPLPPLPEQKRIVKKVSSMLGKLKEARELIQEARDTFEERRAAILNKAFTGELTKKWREENPDVESAEKLIEILIDQKKKQGKKGEIPTYEEMIIEEDAQPYNLPGNWGWVKIGYLLCEVAKKDPKREGIKKFTYLDISSIDNKAGRITDPKTYKGVEAPSRARQIVKTNDILFSTVRTYLKNIAVVDEIYNDQIASTGFCVMRCCGIINSRLLFRFVSSDVFIDRLNGFQRGISYPAVKTSDFLEQPIPLPPLPEQKEIVRILDKLLDHEDEARALIDMEEQIDLLEKSILSKAFRGELGTNDPNDEPAIELLKRSLKEKPKAAKKQDK